MVTAATAPARASVNKFGVTDFRVLIATTTLVLSVASQDSLGNVEPTIQLTLNGAGAQKITYSADGTPAVAFDATKTAQAVGAFNAFVAAVGNAQAKADAMDTYLQGQGIYPA